MSVLLYACETWTLRKRDIDSPMAFEMKCYRRILHIHWQDMRDVHIHCGHSPHTLAAENNEFRDKTKAGHQKECGANDYLEETKIIRAYLQDG